jgi:regulator of protease activity HflC (stomatin/prohibitin superfamily)
MNSVIKAQNTKDAAVDLAMANETQADGKRRAAIKEAEGIKQAQILKAEAEKQSSILVAEGQSKAFDLINRAFKGNAQKLKQMEVTQASLENNSKIIVTDKGIAPQLIIGNLPIDK